MITIPGLRKMYLRLFQLETGVFAVADPGEGPGRPGPPLFFDQNEARRAETQFCGDRPAPCLRVWMTGPLPTPPPLSEGLDPPPLWTSKIFLCQVT